MTILILEDQYEKLLQHTEGVDEDGNPFEFVSGEGDEFNWDEVELKDGRYVVVIDRDDYISINLLNPKKLINGKLEIISAPGEGTSIKVEVVV